MLFAVDLHKDFIDEESITIAAMPSLQSACIDSTEFDAPQADRFPSDDDASFSQKIFDIAVAES